MNLQHHIRTINCRSLSVTVCTITAWLCLVVLINNDRIGQTDFVPIPLYIPDTSIPHRITLLDNSQWLSHPVLKRALDRSDHTQLLNLLKDFIILLNQSAIDVIMVDDTLLGSYLFHDILPWDNNIHVMVNYADRQKIFKLFSQPELRTKYDMVSDYSDENKYTINNLHQLQTSDTELSSELNFKFFHLNSPQDGTNSWGRPYISVKYYKEQDDHIVTLRKPLPDIPVPQSIFFPLKGRPLGNQWLLAPANTRAFLQVKYGKFSCAKTQGIMKDGVSMNVPCSELVHYYPCIHRNWTEEGQAWETLMFHGTPLYTIRVNEPLQVVKGCYDLKMTYAKH